MEGYGISGKIWKWIEDLLLQRNQQVVVNGIKSIVSLVLIGIPQGSVLGPLLFLCFINDMPEVVQSCKQMFADDTKKFQTVNNPDHADNMACTHFRSLEL
jgi:hypothetical protein